MLDPSERKFSDGFSPSIPASSLFTVQPFLHRLRVRIFRTRQNCIASLAFPPQRYVDRDFLFRQFPEAFFRAIPRVRQHPFRFLSAMRFRCFRQWNQTFVVRRILRHFRRHDQPRFFFHRDLSVVALLKAILGLHDPALRIGEVLLLLLRNFSKVPMMSRTPALRPNSRAPSSVVFLAARRAIFFFLPLLQPLFCFLNLLQPVFTPLQLFGKLIAPPLRSILLILGFVNRLRAPQQLRDLPL